MFHVKHFKVYFIFLQYLVGSYNMKYYSLK